jgi:maltooligosyltrehalose trehalohydrolase
MTTLLLLGPWTPMLFQGQEWGSSRPFLYFADHRPELALLVRKGRAEFLAQFPSCATPTVQEALADPAGHATFASAQLDWAECDSPRGQQWRALHQALLAVRANDPSVRSVAAGTTSVDGAVLGPHCLLLRFFSTPGSTRGGRAVAGEADRLLVINLGDDLPLPVVPEPLLAPPPGKTRWQTVFSSEDLRFGGVGSTELDRGKDGWEIPGAAGFLLEAL